MSVLPYRLRKLVAVRPGVKTYQGTDLETDAAVLIHHVHPTAGAAEREERCAGFQALAGRLAGVAHPSLPALRFWTRRPEDPLYLVFDLPYGTGLDALLDRGGPLPWPTARAALRSLADALGAAHRAGVAHLGLRPDRVLLGTAGPPLLVDLGVTALLLADVPRPVPITDPLWRALFPRPELVAPELLAGAPGDARSDVHALGMLLFHVTTLAWPYSSGTSVLVYNQVRAGVSASFLEAALGHTPDGLREVVRRATARDPDARFADGAALAAALDALATPVGGAAAPGQPGASDDALAALRSHAVDAPYTARFGEILRVVDGGRGRLEPPDEEPPVPAPAPLDPAQRAALEAERERQIRLAELTLERLRESRPPQRRRRLLSWLVLASVALAFALFLPRVLEPGSAPVRLYEGGVDPETRLTHDAPRPSPRPGRRPAQDEPVPRARLPLEPR